MLRSVCQDVPDAERWIWEAQIAESVLQEAPGTRGAGDEIAASRSKFFFADVNRTALCLFDHGNTYTTILLMVLIDNGNIGCNMQCWMYTSPTPLLIQNSICR